MAAAPKVAVILSSAQSDSGKAGFDLEELAKAYLTMQDHGVDIVLFSPDGGALPVHQNKDKLAYIQRFKQNKPALAQLANTVPTKRLAAGQFDGVLVIGGDGAMQDLQNNGHISAFIADLVLAGKPVAAVCHGVAALLNVTDADGRPLVRGKRISSFTNGEESLFGKDAKQGGAIRLETRLRELGAHYSQAPAMLPHVAEHGNLITAQNPISVQLATRRFIQHLGLRLKSALHFADDASMELIARALSAGPVVIDTALQTEAARYDADWLSLYAFYGPRDSHRPELAPAVASVAEKITGYFPHPALYQSLVERYVAEKNLPKARQYLARIASVYPKHPRGTMERQIASLAEQLAKTTPTSQ
jgi:putative intracellular protease/amidase